MKRIDQEKMPESSDTGFHKNCFACAQNSPGGLNLTFSLLKDGNLLGEYKIQQKYQGYDDFAHGGIIATILVSSMVKLFHIKYGAILKTIRLNIRYLRPLPTEKTFLIKTFERKNLRSLRQAKAQVVFNGKIYSEAEGYFKESSGKLSSLDPEGPPG